MKEYIKNIIAESLKDEVDVDREWERLFSSIEKKTISKMKEASLEELEEILPRDTAITFKEFLDNYDK